MKMMPKGFKIYKSKTVDVENGRMYTIVDTNRCKFIPNSKGNNVLHYFTSYHFILDSFGAVVDEFTLDNPSRHLIEHGSYANCISYNKAPNAIKNELLSLLELLM